MPLGASTVLAAAAQQNIPLITLAPGQIAAVDALKLPADAKARITTALLAGKQVTVPSQEVTVNGQPAIAWLRTDPITGETAGVGGTS